MGKDKWKDKYVMEGKTSENKNILKLRNPKVKKTGLHFLGCIFSV